MKIGDHLVGWATRSSHTHVGEDPTSVWEDPPQLWRELPAAPIVNPNPIERNSSSVPSVTFFTHLPFGDDDDVDDDLYIIGAVCLLRFFLF